MATHLLALNDAIERLRPFRRRHLGVRAIEVRRIIGTDSRGSDFDREFRALRPDVRERRRRVAEAFADGDFPPITVEKLGDAYFVVDGHHRVAVARQRGVTEIDAVVTELTARWHLTADADCGELIHAEQERLFMTDSGLEDVLPDASFRFTHPVGYRQLLETIQIHGYRLMVGEQRSLKPDEIALDWYSQVYMPALQAIAGGDLKAACPDATVSDTFLWISEQQRTLSVEHGPQQLPEVIRLTASANARPRRPFHTLLRRS
jgi:ParB/Sulfiredoxin domain